MIILQAMANVTSTIILFCKVSSENEEDVVALI